MYVKCECGKIVSNQRKNCFYCGKPTKKERRFVPEERPNLPNRKYCPTCGARLDKGES